MPPLLFLRSLAVPGCAQSPEAQSVACVELGCKFFSLDVDPALALKYSLCKTPAAYAKLVGHLQQMLGLQSIIGTKELAIQFGCIQAHDLARKVLQSYKEKVRGSLPGVASSDSASTILDSRNSYPAVAFYLSCRHLKITGVDRKRLMAATGVTEKEFLAVADSFYQHVPELKPPERKARAPKKAGVKRKNGEQAGEEGAAAAAAAGEQREDDDDDDGDDELPSGGLDDDLFANSEGQFDLADAESNPALAGTKRLGYEKWKQKVAAEAKEEAKLLQPVAKKRKSNAGAVKSTSASPAADSAIASAFLRQSKISFGGPAKKQEQDSGSEGEAEY